ncbi:MAG: RNA-binding S4 domain-containing protein [Clostridia bacterium]
MRLDKFLKVARIIKRRTVANEACSKSRVTVNGRDAKPGKDIKIGDICTIAFGDKIIKFEILEVPTGNVSKTNVDLLYRIIEDEQ